MAYLVQYAGLANGVWLFHPETYCCWRPPYPKKRFRDVASPGRFHRTKPFLGVRLQFSSMAKARKCRKKSEPANHKR
jgi:hypothetical protein